MHFRHYFFLWRAPRWVISLPLTAPSAPRCLRPSWQALAPIRAFQMAPAFQTRRACRRRIEHEEALEAASRHALINLPDEVLLCVFELLGSLDVVLQSGAACKMLRRVSLTGSLWRCIEFRQSIAHKMTDRKLASLLTLVDARSVTESLVLEACNRITGSGLHPLEGSLTLRSLDLRRGRLKRGEIEKAPLGADGITLIKSLTSTSKPWQLNELYLGYDDLVKLTISGATVAASAHESLQAMDDWCENCVEVISLSTDRPQPHIETIQESCSDCAVKLCKRCRHSHKRQCTNCGATKCAKCIVYDKDAKEYVCQDCFNDDDNDGA